MKEYPWGKGTPKWVRDATANDSDKSFTVPAGKIWEIRAIYGKIVCTATVGNRQIKPIFTDGTNTVLEAFANGASITASNTCICNWAAGNPQVNSASNAQQNLPIMILPAGYVMRLYDVSAIDPAADDLTVAFNYVEYDA